MGRDSTPRFSPKSLLDNLIHRFDNEAKARTRWRFKDNVQTPLRVVAVLLVTAIAAFFYMQLGRFLEWPPPVYSSPEVFNLTKNNVRWDTYYGPPVSCGETDCHLTPDYDPDQFTNSQVLPSHEFPLNGYKAGQLIYYRARIQLPLDLLKGKEGLMFHSVYIWAEKYDFFVNGYLLDSGSERLLNVTIPRYMIGEDGVVNLAFRVDPGKLTYQGLANYGELVIGPSRLLEPLGKTAWEVKTTYYLFHLLPRLAICLVFCFIFFTVAKNVENFVFVVYAVLSSLSVLSVSDLTANTVIRPLKSALASAAFAAYASWALMWVMQLFFRRSSRIFLYANIVIGVVLAAITTYAFTVNGILGHKILYRTGNALRLVSSLYGVSLAIATSVYLTATKRSPHRLRASLVIGIFLAVASAFSIAGMLGVLPGAWGGFHVLVQDSLLLLILAALLAMEFGQTVSQRDWIKTTMRSLIDSKVADKLMQDRTILEPKERVVSVLFADIRSFTSFSEQRTPSQVFSFLTEYMEAMVQVINAHDGVIDKFGGDSIMAVWGVPSEDPRHAAKAVRCAVAMRKALVEFNRRREAQGEPATRIGIGIHSGKVISGALGTAERAEYTIIGDTVNTASRLESATKKVGCDLLISAETYSHVQDEVVAEAAGDLTVAGKAKGVSTYRILEWKADVELPKAA